MLILNGISFFFEDSVTVYDTKSGVTRDATLTGLVNMLRTTDETVYGLRILQPSGRYPIDSRYIPELGAVIIPSESQEAMKKYRKK